MRLSRPVWIMFTLAFGCIYAFSAEVTPGDGEEESRTIDLETAARLAIVASYHADYGMAFGPEAKRMGATDRVFAGSFEMSSLDGNEKFYSITLYRGDGEPTNLTDVRERIPAWAELVATYARKRDEGRYEFEMVPPSRLEKAFFFDSMAEFNEYYSCVVPTSTGRGFLSGFNIGIPPQLYYGDVAAHVLAKDLGVAPADVVVKTITPDFDYLCEVSGEEYVVRMGDFLSRKETEIIKGDAVGEALEKGLVPVESGVISLAEERAEEEDITTWISYVERIERKFGFGPGPSINADSVNPVLKGSQESMLYYKGTKGIMVFDSEGDKEPLE
jgi:hypothetical protein